MAENLVKLEITPEGQDPLALMVPIGGVGRLFRMLSGEMQSTDGAAAAEWPSSPVAIVSDGDEMLLTFSVLNCGQVPMAVRLRIGAGQPWPATPPAPTVKRRGPGRRPAGEN